MSRLYRASILGAPTLAAALGCLCVHTFSQTSPGIPPAPAAREYTSYAEGTHLEVGGEIVRKKELQNRFVADVYKGYLVVEVALYPKGGASMNVARDQFVLQTVEGVQTPENPALVAGTLHKAAREETQIGIYPSGEVGYTKGDPYPYDYPGYRTRRREGVYTRVGVGVGVGRGGSGSAPEDLKVTELELTEKGLPEGSHDTPVAGHLYFRLDKKQKATEYRLEYRADFENLVLTLPARRD